MTRPAIELQRRGCTIAHLILLDAQPSTDETVAPDLVESQVLEEVLRFYRVDVPDHDEPLTYQQIEQLVRERGAVEFPRYKQYLDAIVHSLNSSMEMHQAHQPGVFDGDVIIFSAQRDENDDYPPPSQSWQPYVVGDITEYPIACTHKDMLTAESLSLYGPQLKNSLEA